MVGLPVSAMAGLITAVTILMAAVITTHSSMILGTPGVQVGVGEVITVAPTGVDTTTATIMATTTATIMVAGVTQAMEDHNAITGIEAA